MKIVRQIIVDDIPDTEEGLVKRERLINVMVFGGFSSFLSHNLLGAWQNHSFILNGAFDWALGKDEEGNTVLIPLRKEPKVAVAVPMEAPAPKEPVE